MAELRGHLLFRYQGEYFFVPAESIGPPIEISEAERSEINGLVDQMIAEGRTDPIEFAIWVKPAEVPVQVIRGRN